MSTVHAQCFFHLLKYSITEKTMPPTVVKSSSFWQRKQKRQRLPGDTVSPTVQIFYIYSVVYSAMNLCYVHNFFSMFFKVYYNLLSLFFQGIWIGCLVLASMFGLWFCNACYNGPKKIFIFNLNFHIYRYGHLISNIYFTKVYYYYYLIILSFSNIRLSVKI
jgi:hypothetical protein